MTDPKRSNPDDSNDAFDLEIEASPDTDEIMREALQAVESYQLDEVEEVEEEPAENETVVDDDHDADDDGVADLESEAETPGADPAAATGLERKLIEAEERAVRALADYENFRRRVDRERMDFSRYAAEGALTEFLPVIDNLGRAIEAEGGYEDLKSGVEMIHKQMIELLGRLNVNAVPAVGERFDPSVHEAVARVEDEAVDQPTVLDQFQVGYVLHDRLLRPAMVRVAVPSEEPEGSDAEADVGDTDGEGREE